MAGCHPERELITKRYLAHRGSYVRTALERLAEADDTEVEALDNALEAPVVQPALQHGHLHATSLREGGHAAIRNPRERHADMLVSQERNAVASATGASSWIR